jgi:hypothetical protein
MFIKFRIVCWYWPEENSNREITDFKGSFYSQIENCVFSTNKNVYCLENNGWNSSTNLQLRFQLTLVRANFKYSGHRSFAKVLIQFWIPLKTFKKHWITSLKSLFRSSKMTLFKFFIKSVFFKAINSMKGLLMMTTLYKTMLKLIKAKKIP